MRLAVGPPRSPSVWDKSRLSELRRASSGLQGASPVPWGTSPGHGDPAPRCGEPAWAVGIQLWAWESSPKVWEASPERGAVAQAVGSQPWGQGCSPKVWGASPRQWGAPVVAVPGAAPAPRQGAQCLCSPRTPAPFSHTSQWWWVFGGSCSTDILGRWTALQLCRELFEGEQREQRIHLVLGAGSEGRCPLRQQGQTSRTCLVTPLSPCSWSRQFSNPPQCSSSFSSPAPGNPEEPGAGVCHNWHQAHQSPGVPECSMLGSAGPSSCCLFPACWLGSGTQQCGQQQGTSSPGRDLGKIA